VGRTSWLLTLMCGSLLGSSANAQGPQEMPAYPMPHPVMALTPSYAPIGPIIPEPAPYVRDGVAFPLLPPTSYVTPPGWRYRDVYGPNPPAIPVPKKTGFFHRAYDHMFGPGHNYEPDGVPMPIGPSNAFTEFKYVFGSATQFFGTADAAYGHLYKTTVPPPYRIPYLQEPWRVAVPAAPAE
jgi:hypothetical protein